jgi:hypothetical protein
VITYSYVNHRSIYVTGMKDVKWVMKDVKWVRGSAKLNRPVGLIFPLRLDANDRWYGSKLVKPALMEKLGPELIGQTETS